MPNSLLIFTPSMDLNLQNYIEEQILEIQNQFPELYIEHSNELDDRHNLLTGDIIKFPCYIILKENRRKTRLIGKTSKENIISWLLNNLN